MREIKKNFQLKSYDWARRQKKRRVNLRLSSEDITVREMWV